MQKKFSKKQIDFPSKCAFLSLQSDFSLKLLYFLFIFNTLVIDLGHSNFLNSKEELDKIKSLRASRKRKVKSQQF